MVSVLLECFWRCNCGEGTAIFHKDKVMAFEEASEGMLGVTESYGDLQHGEHFEHSGLSVKLV